jgi:predicted DNA-binding transcriptional regulator AlpA
MLLTLAEVARRLGVCDKTARVIAREFPKVRVGNGSRVRYPESAVQSFINSNVQKPEPARLAS